MSELIRKLKEKKYITKIKIKDNISDELISKEIPQVGSAKIVAAVKEEIGPVRPPYAVMRETNPELMDVCVKYKWAANNDYMTYEEAANLTYDMIKGYEEYDNHNDSYITVSKFKTIKSFNEFQHFTSVERLGGSAYEISVFGGCSGLTSIIIPNSVVSIEDAAFKGCTSLESVAVESSNSKYDSRNNCNAIIETDTNTLIKGCKNTIIPNSVVSIDYNAFYECSGLTSITIPNSVTSIGSYAFYGCTGLESIVVESDNSVYDSRDNCNAIIETNANTLFLGCKNTIIPDSVTSISDNAFRNCRGLTSITIGNSVTSIGASAFDGCSSLTSVTIGNSVTSIGAGSFENCKGLTSIIIPDSVTSIGRAAFDGCSSLTSVIIGNSVTSIDDATFYGCSSLTSITIPDSVTTISSNAFRNCRGLTSITIPDSVTSIGNQAFQYCSSLTSITIGNSVTSIGNNVFSGCNSLTSITCLATTAPIIDNYEYPFGYGSYDYTGRDTYNQGVNKLKVPAGATGYDTGAWADPLCNAEKCGFTLENI